MISSDDLLVLISKNIQRIILQLEDYSLKLNNSKETPSELKSFNYYIKLENVLLNVKILIEESRIIEKERITVHSSPEKKKKLEEISNGLNRRLSRRTGTLDIYYHERELNISDCAHFVNETLETETKKDFQKLEYLEFSMLERIFKKTTQ